MRVLPGKLDHLPAMQQAMRHNTGKHEMPVIHRDNA